jgi:FMN phosphatase YigB (HAD superfamily)
LPSPILPAGRVAYVGDRPDNDVAPARALGLTTVRLRRGPHAEQAPRTDAEQPDIEARDLVDAARRLVAWRANLGDG